MDELTPTNYTETLVQIKKRVYDKLSNKYDMVRILGRQPLTLLNASLHASLSRKWESQQSIEYPSEGLHILCILLPPSCFQQGGIEPIRDLVATAPLLQGKHLWRQPGTQLQKLGLAMMCSMN